MVSAAVVRTLLMVDIVTMALLALFFLRHRRMNWLSYCVWGLVAVGVPVLGPFVVIAKRPGQWDPDFTLINDLKHAAVFFKRLLPADPALSPKRLSHADRVRRRRQSRDRKTR